MTNLRPFRFGVVAARARSGNEWADKARRVESLGYATLVMPDTLGPTLSPLPALAAAAAVTRSLRLGTYVLSNDLRNPVLLAHECATLDLLSDGRLEIGLGVGRASATGDYRMLGLPFEAGSVRVARLRESLALIKGLWRGERVSASGPYYAAMEAQLALRPVQQPHPPIMVAGAGKRLLALAAREANIVALGIAPDTPTDAAHDMIAWVREAAGDRWGQLELNTNLIAVGEHIAPWVAARFGIDAAQLRQSQSLAALLGSTDAMCDQLRQRRNTLGISYFTVGEDLMDTFAPVVARLAGS